MTELSLKPPRWVPPLENGDCLSRTEFERRYRAMPNLRKAELIEGIVYMASPLRFEPHAKPHAQMMVWLGTYQAFTPGISLGVEPTVRLDVENETQPDGVLLIDRQRGGQSRLSTDGYIEGAPELVVEIAASSAALDLRDKKRVYLRNGVQEYLVWQVFEQRIDWFSWQAGQYVALNIDETGVVRSRVFPGLWLGIADLIAGNMPRVLAVVQDGLSSKDHRTFVQELARSELEYEV